MNLIILRHFNLTDASLERRGAKFGSGTSIFPYINKFTRIDRIYPNEKRLSGSAMSNASGRDCTVAPVSSPFCDVCGKRFANGQLLPRSKFCTNCGVELSPWLKKLAQE